MGTYVNGGETVFCDGENMSDIGKRAHVLNNSHGRCVIGAFNKLYMSYIFVSVINLFYCLSSTNKNFFALCIMVQDFMTNIYHQKKRWKFIDDDGSGVFHKQKVRKIYNSKY